MKTDVTKSVAMRPRQEKTTAAMGSGSPQRTYCTGIGSQPEGCREIMISERKNLKSFIQKCDAFVSEILKLVYLCIFMKQATDCSLLQQQIFTHVATLWASTMQLLCVKFKKKYFFQTREEIKYDRTVYKEIWIRSLYM